MGKPKNKVNQTAYTQREIGESLNNAVAATLKAEGQEISDSRLRQLRAYAQALIETPVEHAEEGLLSFEELRAVMAVGAMYVHMKFVAETEKLPLGRQTKILHD